jgi:hypothetical protein
MFWWFLGPLTLLPLLARRPVAWDLGDARAVLPSLFGHLFYGAVTAVVFVMLRRDPVRMRPRATTAKPTHGESACTMDATVGRLPTAAIAAPNTRPPAIPATAPASAPRPATLLRNEVGAAIIGVLR